MPGRACRCTAGARILVVRVRLPGAGGGGPAPPECVEPPAAAAYSPGQRPLELGQHPLLLAQVVLAQRPGELLQQLALAPAQPARDDDVDHHAQVAGTAAADRPEATAGQDD